MSQLALTRCDIPNDLIYLIILELVKDTIGPDKHVIEVVHAAFFDNCLRFTRYNALDTAQVHKFGLAVAKGAADGEPAGENSIRADEGVLLLVAVLLRWNGVHLNLLSACRWIAIIHNCLGLIDVTTCFCDSIELDRIGGLVVPRKLLDRGSCLHIDLSNVLWWAVIKVDGL